MTVVLTILIWILSILGVVSAVILLVALTAWWLGETE